MIIENANIITMDPALPRMSVIYIAGGRILAGVDNREDAIAGQIHERIDLNGATVMPGFVDSHVHFTSWARSRKWLNLVTCKNEPDVIKMVREESERSSEQLEWILGRGWMHLQNPLGALNHAAPNRPVLLVANDGHSIAVNSFALESLGLNASDFETEGGVVERDENSKFNGILRERSAWKFQRLFDDRNRPDEIRDLAKAMREASSRGITALHDFDGAKGLRTWSELEIERSLSLRVWEYVREDDLEHLEHLSLPAGFGSDHLKIAGLKIFIDGTLSSGTAWCFHDDSGVVLCDTGRIRQMIDRASRARLPIAMHVIGDKAFNCAIDALEATRDSWSRLGAPPRLEHAQLCRLDDIKKAGHLGVALSVQPSHIVDDLECALNLWRPDITDSLAYGWRSMLEAGAPLLLGSDAPVADLNPLKTIHNAVTEHALGASSLGEPIGIDDALAATVSTPHWAVGASESLGILAPGRLADLVVLSDDPTKTDVAEISVIATMVGGRWTYGASNLN